jgi:hypothetical protein
MPRLAAAAAVTVVAATAAMSVFTAAAAPSQCGDWNACRHTWYEDSGVGWVWDLCGLCKEIGSEYVWSSSDNHTYIFNVGGTAGGAQGPGGPENNGVCTPPWTVFASTGIMREFWTGTPSCAGGPDGTCRDPEQGNKSVCCSGDCTVTARLGMTPSPANATDPANPATGGIDLYYQGLPPSTSDPFVCGLDPVTGQNQPRALIQRLYCDQAGQPDVLTILNISQPQAQQQQYCLYLLEAKSKAACATQVAAAL